MGFEIFLLQKVHKMPIIMQFSCNRELIKTPTHSGDVVVEQVDACLYPTHVIEL